MSDNNNNNNASSLRPPSSAAPQTHSMGSAPIGRSSSPLGSNPARYSLGKPSTPSEQMLRKAHDVGGAGGGLRSPSAHMSLGSAGLGRFGPRPSSEMLGMAGANNSSAEQDAIDKWFEDLQHYEATLEEMAAASLDQNFKEELSAIEQWFRVLSEAERTAALYSLLQESTQVQIRFFITVLQQMARSDPMSALLSPSANNPMAEQMEAKLASLGLKSPTAMKTPASPSNRATHSYLSPNAASLNFSPGSDAAATLAAQRAKLKANRVSAPGTFTGDQRGESQRNFSQQGGGLDQVQERSGASPNIDRARSPGLDTAGRPKSIDVLGANSKSPRRSGPLDDQLSPVPSSGNWASMVNTPLTNMFDDVPGANVNLDAASAQLASVAEGGQAGGIQLDQDMSKYQRRRSGQPGYDQQYTAPGSGHSPNLGSSAWPGSSGSSAQQQGQQPDFLRACPNPSSAQFPGFQTMSPNSFAGLQSPSGGFSNGLNMQMMNAMAAMGGLNNVNAAQFLAMQQQILQNQQNLAAMAAMQQQQSQQQRRGDRSGGLTTPHTAAMAGRRSPAATNRSLAGSSAGPARGNSGSGATGSASAGASGGGGEEEVPDLSILNDVPAWLRHLRLHKYTPNFEASNWKEMCVMTDADLEAKGVAALGARRKLLKTFRAVREKHGIKGEDDEEKPGDGVKGAAVAAAAGKKEGGEGAE